MEATELTAQMGEPSPAVKAFIGMISAATGIPQRLLLGNEAGDLASSQDAQNWANVIDSRWENYCDPFILRPFANRLIWYGALPQPARDVYTTEGAPMI